MKLPLAALPLILLASPALAAEAPDALTLDAASLSIARTGEANAPLAAIAMQRTAHRILAVQAKTPLPSQLTPAQRQTFHAIFAAIRSGQWDQAQAGLAAAGDGPLTDVATAELYLANGAPAASADQIVALLNRAPQLPEAEGLARLAAARGATSLPMLPAARDLGAYAGIPGHRGTLHATAGDPAASALAERMKPLIQADDAAGAETLLGSAGSTLSPEAQTEWQSRVAWSYFGIGDDVSARRLAIQARGGAGDWAAQGAWVEGLAAWRQHDFATAADAFATVTARAADNETRAAGLFWNARAEMAAGHPDRVEQRLRTAARLPETFYGLLAGAALGLPQADAGSGLGFIHADWTSVADRPNVRAAAALVEAGEIGLADQMLRHQARIGPAQDHGALLRLAGRLNLPATQLWLARNGPDGAGPDVAARYPAPAWTPEGGWRVDKSLVYAHALQESAFRTDAVSRAGARGLMQVLPGTAQLIARDHGMAAAGDLSDPAFNIECGQSYLEQLRDAGGTNGLLPKVIAAYNAGPGAVARWNGSLHDGGDPLLYIESIPYAETRGYVVAVLRNYWMYQAEAGERSPSLAALAQGMWPRFPGMPGAAALRIERTSSFASR